MVSSIKQIELASCMDLAALVAEAADCPDRISAAIYGIKSALTLSGTTYDPVLVPAGCPETIRLALEAEWPWYRVGWAIGILLPYVLILGGILWVYVSNAL